MIKSTHGSLKIISQSQIRNRVSATKPETNFYFPELHLARADPGPGTQVYHFCAIHWGRPRNVHSAVKRSKTHLHDITFTSLLNLKDMISSVPYISL